MATEIERKFLLTESEPTCQEDRHASWRRAEPVLYCQGYLNRDKARTVRVRIAGNEGRLTVKGPTIGATRAEFEYAIPVADARAMLALCESGVIEKYRRKILHHGLVWEVDEFLGDNAGLIVAEVELEHEDQPIELPGWIGQEVTNDPRYFNSSLSSKPFQSWH